jgi:hypothetical protein
LSLPRLARQKAQSDAPRLPQPVQPPKGAPDVVLILLDDAGFGPFSTLGGGVWGTIEHRCFAVVARK